jgi:protein pelota
MKILGSDLKAGFLKVSIDSLNDLWYLSDIIEVGDTVGGSVERKLNLGGEGEKAKIIKKRFFAVIRVEKVDFSAENDILRINGVIVQAPDDIPKGEHQSIPIELNTTVSITKQEWLSYQVDRINEATKQQSNILIVIFDREEAYFYTLKSKGFELLIQIKGDVQKKDFEDGKGNFYRDIADKIKEYRERLQIKTTIVASPSFWKEYLFKEMDDEESKGIISSSCSDVNDKTINEVLKRPELKRALEDDKQSQELTLIEELLANIHKNNAFYGMKESKEKIAVGNVITVLVSDLFIKECREKGIYRELDHLMKLAEKNKAKVILLSSDEAANKLSGLGGIAGIKRWKEEY